MYMTQAPPLFAAGANIAMKVPAHLFDQMRAFYADTLGLQITEEGDSLKVAFGAWTLWLDRSPAMTQPELWLELTTPDTAAAARHLADKGVVRCDEAERLYEGFDGFWIAAPGGMVHLVKSETYAKALG